MFVLCVTTIDCPQLRAGANVGYLTPDQALADYAVLLTSIKVKIT